MDIDIDLQNNKQLIDMLGNYIVKASMVENNELKQHLVGVYFQTMPIDNMTQLAAIPYKHADYYGYKKIDLLNLNLLTNISSREELNNLIDEEPDWDMLKHKNIVESLFHISNHFDVVAKVNPRSVDELADVLALIRPNKKHLLNKYIKNKNDVLTELYHKEDASDMRRSHAISYALNIVLQMNLIKRK